MPVCSCQIGAGAEMAGTVPETVLKKRKRDEEWATKKAAQQADAKKKAKESRKEIFKRAEQYVKEYRAKVCTRVALCGARRHPLCVQSLQRAAKRCSVCSKVQCTCAEAWLFAAFSSEWSPGLHLDWLLLVLMGLCARSGGRHYPPEAGGEGQERLLCRAGGQGRVCGPHPRNQRHAPEDAKDLAAAAAAADPQRRVCAGARAWRPRSAAAVP